MYNKRIEDVLSYFQKKCFTYDKVATLTNYKKSTVRKWCKRYKVDLLSSPCSAKAQKNNENEDLRSKIKVSTVSANNVLYKSWCANSFYMN